LGGPPTGAVGIQLVHYGRAHDNPPVQAQPPWDARTETLARRACMDCHSNETVWPWYANIAPVSWLLQRDVEEGRAAVNFSEWTRPQEEAEEIAEVVRDREMPPRLYPLTHPEANLSPEERRELADGLARIAPGTNESDGHEEDDD
jgi:hypothetical protein